MVKDGFQTVIAAVEGIFSCLNVQCSDLNTMYGGDDRVAVGTPADTACPHWNACEDGANLPRDACEVLPTCGDEANACSEPEKASGSTRVHLTVGVFAATLAFVG